VVVVLPNPFRGMGAQRNSTETQQSGPHPKVWTRGQKWKKWCRRWRAGEARMRDSHGGGESDPAEGVHRRCMKNSPFLSCIGKRTKEGCDRGGEVDSSQRIRRRRASSSKETEGIWQERELWERVRLHKEKQVCLIFTIVGARGQETWVTGMSLPLSG